MKKLPIACLISRYKAAILKTQHKLAPNSFSNGDPAATVQIEIGLTKMSKTMLVDFKRKHKQKIFVGIFRK